MTGSAIRRLRQALGLTQQQLAQELEMSIASIQSYERGSRPSQSAVDKLKTMAARAGLADIAIELGDRTFGVSKLFGPGTKRVRVPSATGVDMGDALHDALDQVLAGNDSDLIQMVESVLLVAVKVAEQGPLPKKKGAK
jgi:transcriptional regulator with XRE-family HTH domain